MMNQNGLEKEQQRIYKIREQAIKRIRILENLVYRIKSSLDDFNYFTSYPTSFETHDPIEGGRFATSDLNELYRRIITIIAYLDY
jgi:hypothetical protein